MLNYIQDAELFEGVCFENFRHPDPRRVDGRCRAAVRGQDPVDPVDPRMGSFLRILGVFYGT